MKKKISLQNYKFFIIFHFKINQSNSPPTFNLISNKKFKNQPPALQISHFSSFSLLSFLQSQNKNLKARLLRLQINFRGEKQKHAVNWREKNRERCACRNVKHPLRFFTRHFTACFDFW